MVDNYSNPRYRSSKLLWMVYHLPANNNSFRQVADSLQVDEESLTHLCLTIAIMKLRGVSASEQDLAVAAWLEQSGHGTIQGSTDSTFYQILIQNVDLLADVMSGIIAKTINLSYYEWIGPERVVLEHDSLVIGINVIESLV